MMKRFEKFHQLEKTHIFSRMSNYHVHLQPSKLYHIFNRAIGNDLLFRTEDNFGFLLRKYVLHAQTVCDTFGYNLIPDSMHDP